MVEITDTLPCACWLASIEAVGIGAQVWPICFAPRDAAERHVAGLVDLLDCDQVERPTWSLLERHDHHRHTWTPATSPAEESR